MCTNHPGIVNHIRGRFSNPQLEALLGYNSDKRHCLETVT